MAKRGKKYTEALKQVDTAKLYSLTEAVALAKKINTTKFDASVEISFNLNVDPRHADQQIRGAMVLPNGTGPVSYTHLPVFRRRDSRRHASGKHPFRLRRRRMEMCIRDSCISS